MLKAYELYYLSNYSNKQLIFFLLIFVVQNSQLGCACPPAKCYPEKCDHVYLFDNDYENAEDIHGKSMRGRFPYDEKGRILLEVMLSQLAALLQHGLRSIYIVRTHKYNNFMYFTLSTYYVARTLLS